MFDVSSCRSVSVSRGDVPRNDDVSRNGYVPEDYFPDEPKYDKLAYENDKKMWGIDDLSEDEGANIMRNDRPRKQRKPHYTSGATQFVSWTLSQGVIKGTRSKRYHWFRVKALLKTMNNYPFSYTKCSNHTKRNMSIACIFEGKAKRNCFPRRNDRIWKKRRPNLVFQVLIHVHPGHSWLQTLTDSFNALEWWILTQLCRYRLYLLVSIDANVTIDFSKCY